MAEEGHGPFLPAVPDEMGPLGTGFHGHQMEGKEDTIDCFKCPRHSGIVVRAAADQATQSLIGLLMFL